MLLVLIVVECGLILAQGPTWRNKRSLLLKLHVGQRLLVLQHAGIEHGGGTVGFLKGWSLWQWRNYAMRKALLGIREGRGGTRNEDGMAMKGKRKYRTVIVRGSHFTAHNMKKNKIKKQTETQQQASSSSLYKQKQKCQIPDCIYSLH